MCRDPHFMMQWLWNNIPRHLRLAQKGYVVAVIQYRPSDIAPFPAQMQMPRQRSVS